ncbi:MAG: hypothetical protein V4577_13530 [Bacteroidota bacterium]
MKATMNLGIHLISGTKVSTKFQFVLWWYSKTLHLIDLQWYITIKINKKRGVLALFDTVFGVPKMLQIQL